MFRSRMVDDPGALWIPYRCSIPEFWVSLPCRIRMDLESNTVLPFRPCPLSPDIES